MKYLFTGGGAREHALADHVHRTEPGASIFAAPGNPGIAAIGECRAVAHDDVEGIVALAREIRPDITVVGPEAGLVKGIVDRLEAEGLAVVGPRKNAAWLEGSKAEARWFMKDNRIRTPRFLDTKSYHEACEFMRAYRAKRLVIKADGLCGGKGVELPDDDEQAKAIVREMLSATSEKYGKAGERIVLEERLFGTECSYIPLIDGKHALPMLSSRDYKRRFEGDKGPNTGGMGCICPNPLITPDLEQRILSEVVYPTIEGMQKRGTPFKGFLYCGLMITPKDEIYVLEYNVRMGDPEACVIMPLLETPSGELYRAVVSGRLNEVEAKWSKSRAVATVLVERGYPGKYPKGAEIRNLDLATSQEGVFAFHAGTAMKDGKLVTDGGRVVDMVGMAPAFAEAAVKSRLAADTVQFGGKDYRADIAMGV